MPIQLGENWWGVADLATGLATRTSDLAMLDVMRIGGVTGRLHAAGLTDAARIAVSSHIFPEVSAHLLAVTPTADRLEYLDFAGPILARPLQPVDATSRQQRHPDST